MNFKDKIKGKTFVGIVEDNNDPEKKLRLKIRIPYFHGTKKQIPTENLPWSSPKKNNAISSIVPDINKIVNVTFPYGEILYSEYDNVEHFDINLQNKIDTLEDKEYTEFISLCYNYNTQIYISNDEGLNLYHRKSGLHITDKGDVVTRLNGNESTYYIGDENATQAMMLGNNFMNFMDSLMNMLPTAYLDSNGAPCTASPNLLQIKQQYNMLKKDFISSNVFISDNKTISNNDVKTTTQIGDKFETINETEEIKLVIEELEEELKRDEIHKEEEKKEDAGLVVDEKINADDGLLSNKNKDVLEEHVQESKNMITTNVELGEEISSEGSQEDEDSYFMDFYNDDTGGFSSPVTNTDGPIAGVDDQDSYWNPEYHYPPPVPESTYSVGGSPVNGTSGGIKTKRANISNKIEPLDLSILPAPGMMSKFLSYDKCLFSSTAKARGIANNPDNNDHLRNLVRTTSLYWDIPFKFFKEKLGYILVINSAYRNYELNKAIGGSTTSQHKTGSALDIILTKDGKSWPHKDRLNNLLFYYLKHKFDFYGQLIWEGNASDGPQWVHISINNAGKQGQILALEGGVIKEPNAETVKILKEHGIWKPEKEKKVYT